MLGMAIWVSCNTTTEDPEYRRSIAAHRQALNEEFFDPAQTPLDSARFAGFGGLKFYPIDEQYKVKATLKHLSNEPVFNLPHSHESSRPYKNYAVATFTLHGKTFELLILEQAEKRPGLENYLLLPFSDETNGSETYEAGRYLDLEKTEAKEIELDFNKAYNPYCAYSNNYFCPIPPPSNHLSTRIEAGVKYP